MKTVANRRNRNTFRAVIFDMDGVIVNSHPVHRKAWQQFLCLLGHNVSESELDYILDGRKRADILCHFLGPLSAEQILNYGQHKDRFFQESATEVQPIPGLIDFVEHVARRQRSMAVATSASESRTRFTLEQLGLRPYFDAVVTGKDVTIGKPAPDIYRAACKCLNVEPQSSIAFEDAVAGVEAAKAAGLRCVGVLSHQPASKLIAAGADLTIRDFIGLTFEDLENELAPHREAPQENEARS
jgi:HAD superfamily hydrolase (TIGR01509 family)